MPERALQYMPLDEILPALRNPKGHDEQLIDRLIKEHGFLDALVLDDRTGRLIAGHGRLEQLTAAHAAGAQLPDGIITIEDGRWAAPVLTGWASRDDDQAHAAGVGLNQGTIAGGFIPQDLAPLLEDLKAAGYLDGTGFTPADLDALQADLRGPDPDLLDSGSQPRLDHLNNVTCPECGHEFRP
jgi:hypothetical protein